MSFGLYMPGRSPIHRLPVGVKLAAMAIAGIGMFVVSNLVALVALLGFVGLLLAIARLPYRMVLAQLRPLTWVFAFILVAHALLTTWQTGAVLVLRFAILVLLATLTAFTTRTMDMVEAIAHGLRPFKRFGVEPETVSLMVAIAIRFIPVLLEQIRDIQDAQRARGIERPLIALLVPLLIRVMRMADALTDALDARGFPPD